VRKTGTVKLEEDLEGALARRAEAIAEQVAEQAGRYETRTDRRRRKLVGRIVAAPEGRDFLIELTDQVLRVPSPPMAALLLSRLAHRYRPGEILGPGNGAALVLAARAAPLMPRLVLPVVQAKLRHQLAALVFPAEADRLSPHIARRRAQGISININLLGEAVLGDDEARARTEHVCELLGRPDVSYVSVKISSICAHLDVLDYEGSLRRICERLRTIFAQAAMARPAKFVNLDMEEYRDLWLTVDSFMTVLGEADFASLDAGIVLQAYLPDSHEALRRLSAWARQRHDRHGSSVKVRLVKGANLAMEHVDAELHGWPSAPYASKEEVDASYKRLLSVALDADNAGALRVGLASHNLFDVGWALAQRETKGPAVGLGVEMLEGMANPEALAVRAAAGSLLLYTPVVPRSEFPAAVAYLVRRFDENTSPENFLAQLFDLKPGTPRWADQRDRFRRSLRAERDLDERPRRAQDRRREQQPGQDAQRPHDRSPQAPPEMFTNAPDTDFSQRANRDWVRGHLQQWRLAAPKLVPAVVAGEVVESPPSGTGTDPSRPGESAYSYVEADQGLVERAVQAAVAAGAEWGARPAVERRDLLHAAARVMEAERGQTIAAMVFDGGKTVAEADPEVSEAVDFARYYGQEAARPRPEDIGSFEPYRVVVVTPPWNFPYAIPASGVFAALAAGSAVILKPAPETVLTAWMLVRQCHAAGLPADVLQFLPCADGDIGKRLVTHPDVDAVVLTGAFETARRFLDWKPDLRLHAETSGKNAIVVTGSADVDDAIRDLLHSAFSHSGQKCSAASLGIVQASLYDDPRFLARLADATRSLRVGPADDPATQVGPMIRPPEGRLLGFLTSLSTGERWLVRPEQVGANPQLWRPGVKVGVVPGSEFHLEECFGPVLGLMRYGDLDEALTLQNASAFGLTGGIQSLDPEEASRWCDKVEVGNVYVNRHITGAIVRRQPFGGWKRSCAGRRAKAGGPNYLGLFGTWRHLEEVDLEAELAQARLAWPELARGSDPSALAAEANVLRLRPLRRAAMRLGKMIRPEELSFSLRVAALVGTQVELSVPEAALAHGHSAVVETEAELIERLSVSRPARVRCIGAGGRFQLDVIDAGYELISEPVAPVAYR
jgi:RHH-type transcriptional regulator, proline utilization regulon repressor / proline dehydrogenase / delta 1-pyrroline-5-carboxylate dehydrogenase